MNDQMSNDQTGFSGLRTATDGRALRVGLDGFNLAMRRGTGVATYARALSHCVADLGHRVDVLYGMNFAAGTPEALREIIFFDSLDHDGERAAPKFGSPRALQEILAAPFPKTAVEVPLTGRVMARGFSGRLPRHDRILNIRDLFPMATRYFRRTRRFLPIRIPDGPDIMHWTYPLPIRLLGAKNIYTVHDVVPLRLPYTTLDNKRHHFRLLAGILKHGGHICTVSESSRRDILSFYPQAEGRITNTYQSIVIPPEFDARSDADVGHEILGLFGLAPQNYFLFFGSIEPKKNVGRIIEAYLTSGTQIPLVIVGAQAWKSEHELRLIKTAAATVGAGRIRQFDYLPSALLLGLIRSARAVLFPSLYEGFGLPVLEAMALGTPVLTSREGSLPEIGGEAAWYADAYDAGDIAAGIGRLDRDDALRAALSQAGRARAALFDMASYRERVAAMYDVVGRSP